MTDESMLGSAGYALFKGVVTTAFDYIRAKTGKKLQQWSVEKKIDSLYLNIAEVRNVKTIWQVDKVVDINEFYCDSHVLDGDDRTTIKQLSDFKRQGNLVVEGIAGQGKSIFLRYLCAVELAMGNCIPIHLELRKVNENQPLSKRIRVAFQSLGLEIDDELFAALADSGKLVLFLDAFDEITSDLKPKVLGDLEDLATIHKNLRIIVTSRPNDAVQMSNQFGLVRLDNLRGIEYKTVIRKLAAGEDWADALIEHIETRAQHIRGPLCTPLMVTLLVISYKSHKTLPNQMAEFYEDLFQTLLQRHDGTKPGFTRERQCPLDDGQYRRLFERLCIRAKKERTQSFSHHSIQEIARSAVEQSGYQGTRPDHFLSDLVRITCLMIKDGEEYRFIHKTIQEYYTASFISKQPERWAAEFYSKVSYESTLTEWYKELDFLSEIDSHRYQNHFYLPLLLRFLGVSEASLDDPVPPLSQEWLRPVLDLGTFAVDPYGVLNFIMRASDKISIGFLEKALDVAMQLGVFEDRLLHSDVEDGEIRAVVRISAHYKQLVDTEDTPLAEALATAGVMKEFLEGLEPVYVELFQEARFVRDGLRMAENADILDGLL